MVAGINVIPVAWIIDNSYHSTTVFIAEVYINPLNLKQLFENYETYM